MFHRAKGCLHPAIEGSVGSMFVIGPQEGERLSGPPQGFLVIIFFRPDPAWQNNLPPPPGLQNQAHLVESDAWECHRRNTSHDQPTIAWRAAIVGKNNNKSMILDEKIICKLKNDDSTIISFLFRPKDGTVGYMQSERVFI